MTAWPTVRGMWLRAEARKGRHRGTEFGGPPVEPVELNRGKVREQSVKEQRAKEGAKSKGAKNPELGYQRWWLILKYIKLFSAPGPLHNFPWPRSALAFALCMAHSCSSITYHFKCHLLGKNYPDI